MVVVTGMKCHRRDCVNACVGHVIATIWPDADGSNTELNTCLLSGAEAPWVPILSNTERDSRRPELRVRKTTGSHSGHLVSIPIRPPAAAPTHIHSRSHEKGRKMQTP